MTDRSAGTTQKLVLELRFNRNEASSIRIQTVRDRYELIVSPGRDGTGVQLSLNRRGPAGFELSTNIDPKRSQLLSRLSHGEQQTEVLLLPAPPKTAP